MLARLREADSLSDLAWALTLLAEIELRRGDRGRARAHAEEALAAAERGGARERGGHRARDPGRRGSESGRVEAARTAPNAADLTARARRYMEEKRHGDTRPRADVRDAGDDRGPR